MKKIVKRKRPFLIAEIGINHNGSIKLAKKLIDLAKKYNFDSVKFQKRDSDICVPEHQKGTIRNTPWGVMTYLEYRKKITEQKIVQMKKDAIKSIKDAAVKISIESATKLIKTSINKSKLDTLFEENLNQTKNTLKKTRA